MPVLRAIAHGMIDAYLPAPGAGRDEGFHRAVSELLEEWAHEAAPALPAVRIIAQQQSARAHELRDVLARNSVPYVFHAAESADGQSWLAQAGQDGSVLPVLVTYTGQVLVDPPNDQIAAVFGLASLPAGTVDVAIVGAGPAGLSAAVYAASEGLSTLLLEREAIGGQAGSSSLIRNYLGFPRGISGASLATRAFEQAWSFGAIPSMAGPVTGLAARRRRLHPAPGRRPGQPRPHRPDHHRRVLPQARRSRPGLPARRRRLLRGAASESSAFAGEHVFIAGGANSAGQAAVNLARYAQQVTIVVRGDSLAARMSQYLIDEISATPNIDVRTTHPDRRRRRHRQAGGPDRERHKDRQHPDRSRLRRWWCSSAPCHTPTGSRPKSAATSTGSSSPEATSPSGGNPAAGWTLPRPPLPLETSMPGVFAAGDVRHGSVKRVASAVGEGSIAATQMTQYLQKQARSS